MQFEIRDSASPTQPYYWRIVSGNNVLATSETYHNKADAQQACESVKRNAATAPIVDKTRAGSRRW